MLHQSMPGLTAFQLWALLSSGKLMDVLSWLGPPAVPHLARGKELKSGGCGAMTNVYQNISSQAVCHMESVT